MKNSKGYRRELLWMLVGAALTALTLILPWIGLLEWVTMIPLCVGLYRLCERDDFSLRRAYGYGFLTVYVFYFFLYNWFVSLYPLDFAGLDNASSAIVVVAGWFGLPILQAVVGGFVFLLYRSFSKTEISQKYPLMRPFVLAALWVGFEWCGTLTFAGIPWGRLALGQIKLLPMLQSASLLGSYFVTFLLVAVNGILAYMILNRKKTLVCAVLAGSIFFSNLLFGSVRMLLPDGEERTVRVAVIQGNVDSHDKWGSEASLKTKQAYGDMTRRAAAEGAELIIWPETAFPSDISYNCWQRRFVSELAVECNVTIIVGAFYYQRGETYDDGKNYNALYLVEPDGTFHENFYAKRRLVPFGEYMPMREFFSTLIPPLEEIAMLDRDLAAGEDSGLFDTEYGKIGSLICFDSIYETLTIDSARDGANLIVLATNDSWFYDSAGVYQHQAQAQLRAIESGRAIARAANTGVSTIITPEGELLGWVDPLVDGYAVADIPIEESKTLYTVIGNLFVYLCIAFGIGILPADLLIKEIRKRKKTENEA